MIKKTTNKYVLYSAILAIVLLISYILYFKTKTNVKLSNKPDVYTEVTTWKDKYNNEHATLQTALLEKDAFKKQVDSISEVLKVSKNNIDGVLAVTSKTDTFFKPQYIPIYENGKKYFGFEKKDNYLTLTGIIRDTNDISINLQSFDTLHVVSYHKTKFLGATTNYVDISNSSPYNKIVSGYSYIQKERTKRFGIGPNVSYDPINNRVTVGVGLQYNLIRF